MSRNCVDCKWHAANFDPPRKWWQIGPGDKCRNPKVKTDPVYGGPDSWEQTCKRQRVLEGWPGCCNKRGAWFEPINAKEPA